jgi:hypothetical protein
MLDAEGSAEPPYSGQQFGQHPLERSARRQRGLAIADHGRDPIERCPDSPEFMNEFRVRVRSRSSRRSTKRGLAHIPRRRYPGCTCTFDDVGPFGIGKADLASLTDFFAVSRAHHVREYFKSNRGVLGGALERTLRVGNKYSLYNGCGGSPSMNVIYLTLDRIRAKAAELRESFGDEARARTLEWAVKSIEDALRARESQPLTLTEASLRSGYSADHLARLLRQGKLPNAGRRGAPRIRAGDLPVRQHQNDVAVVPRTEYDPITDARNLRLASRLGGIAYGDSPAEPL